MRKYNYDQIREMLKPIFEFMATEYPNDYCLIIKSDSAELFHNSSEMVFLNNPPVQTVGGFMAELFKAFYDGQHNEGSSGADDKNKG